MFFIDAKEPRWALRVRVGGYAWVGEKKIGFGRNALRIVIFWYFIPYPLSKTHDGWVWHEGKGGPD
jgi:hypothetical protein